MEFEYYINETVLTRIRRSLSHIKQKFKSGEFDEVSTRLFDFKRTDICKTIHKWGNPIQCFLVTDVFTGLKYVVIQTISFGKEVWDLYRERPTT